MTESRSLIDFVGTDCMMDAGDETARALNALMRAAAFGSPEDQVRAHRRVVEMGSAAVGGILDWLGRVDWSRVGARGGTGPITAFALALHDIDEAASRSFFDELLATEGVHPVYRERLKTVLGFSVRDYVQASVLGSTVFTHTSVPLAQLASERVASWLRPLPHEDLRGLTRVYVVPRVQDEYWGEYLHVLSRVVVVWRGNGWLDRLRCRSTLYHEVGHHVVQDEDMLREERELAAELYAFEQMRQACLALRVPGLRGLIGRLLHGRWWPSVRRGARARAAARR